MEPSAPIVRAHESPTHAFQAWNLETGDTAVILTRPYRLKNWERWSWKRGEPVRLKDTRRRGSVTRSR